MHSVWEHFLLKFTMKFHGHITFVFERKCCILRFIIRSPLNEGESGRLTNIAVLFISINEWWSSNCCWCQWHLFKQLQWTRHRARPFTLIIFNLVIQICKLENHDSPSTQGGEGEFLRLTRSAWMTQGVIYGCDLGDNLSSPTILPPPMAGLLPEPPSPELSHLQRKVESSYSLPREAVLFYTCSALFCFK